MVHCTTKQYNTRNELQCSAMKKNFTLNQGEQYKPVRILGGHDE